MFECKSDISEDWSINIPKPSKNIPEVSFVLSANVLFIHSVIVAAIINEKTHKNSANY